MSQRTPMVNDLSLDADPPCLVATVCTSAKIGLTHVIGLGSACSIHIPEKGAL